MSPRITALPKKVKLLSGMVKSPVTHVADVAVKKRSINDIGFVFDMDSDRSNVPHKIRTKNEKKIICAGDISIILFLLIKTFAPIITSFLLGTPIKTNYIPPLVLSAPQGCIEGCTGREGIT